MKFEPVNKWIIGHALVPKVSSTIVLPGMNNKGVTRCYLITESSKEAAEAGYKPGDLVIAKHVWDITLKGHRVTFTPDEIICRVKDCTLDEFTDLQSKPVVESLPEAAERFNAAVAKMRLESAEIVGAPA